MKKFYLYFVLIICITKCENAVNKKCLPIKECKEILDLLQKRPVTKQTRDYIVSLKCGEGSRFPKVWCEEKESNKNGRDLLPNPANEECGSQSKRTMVPALAGGEDARNGEFPWMAMLEYRLRNKKLAPQCGGSLINNRYILTAAHCVLINARQGVLESVLLGELNVDIVSDNEKRYQVDSFIVHPSYADSAKAGQHHNDIGLVRLKDEVTYTDFIIPICLPHTDFMEKLDFLQVAGWGTTEKGIASPHLQKLYVPSYDSLRCTDYLMYNVTETQLCAGGEAGKDSCKGDSGGPLMEHTQGGYTAQVGVVSLSIGKVCGAGRPNIYTHVQKFVTWIYDTVKP